MNFSTGYIFLEDFIQKKSSEMFFVFVSDFLSKSVVKISLAKEIFINKKHNKKIKGNF